MQEFLKNKIKNLTQFLDLTVRRIQFSFADLTSIYPKKTFYLLFQKIHPQRSIRHSSI